METSNESLGLIRSALSGGGLQAEAELKKVADTEGDLAIKKIAENLSPAEISSVTAEGDYTSPSLLHSAISVEQFIKVFKLLGLNRPSPSDILHFFQAFFFLNEEEKRLEMVDAVLQESHGLAMIITSVMFEKDFEEFMEEAAHSPVERFAFEANTWEEILKIIALYHKESWNSTVSIVKGFYLDEEKTAQRMGKFFELASAEAYAIAVEEKGGSTLAEENAEDELFTPIAP